MEIFVLQKHICFWKKNCQNVIEIVCKWPTDCFRIDCVKKLCMETFVLQHIVDQQIFRKKMSTSFPTSLPLNFFNTLSVKLGSSVICAVIPHYRPCHAAGESEWPGRALGRQSWPAKVGPAWTNYFAKESVPETVFFLITPYTWWLTPDRGQFWRPRARPGHLGSPAAWHGFYRGARLGNYGEIWVGISPHLAAMT